MHRPPYVWAGHAKILSYDFQEKSVTFAFHGTCPHFLTWCGFAERPVEHPATYFSVAPHV